MYLSWNLNIFWGNTIQSTPEWRHPSVTVAHSDLFLRPCYQSSRCTFSLTTHCQSIQVSELHCVFLSPKHTLKEMFFSCFTWFFVMGLSNRCDVSVISCFFFYTLFFFLRTYIGIYRIGWKTKFEWQTPVVSNIAPHFWHWSL